MHHITYDQLTPEIAAAGCLVAGMPNDAYHAYPAWNKSSLDLIARSPAHYRYSAKRESTRAMEIGSAVHAAILEPELFASDYMLLQDVKDRRSSEYKEACKTYPADRVLTGTEAAQVSGIQASVRCDMLNEPGWAEISVFATCPETGLLIKCRFDYLTTDGRALDLKTTQDARAAEFAKSVFNYRYHVQDAFYRHAFAAATGNELQSFTFLAVEKEPPFYHAEYDLDAEAQEIGRFYALRDLRTAAECERSGEWPAPANDSRLLSLPGWAVSEYETMLEETIV